MKEDKDQPSKVSTCLEGSPWAEMMQKIMDEQRAGSPWEEMMRTLMKTSRDGKENPRETHKEQADGRKE